MEPWIQMVVTIFLFVNHNITKWVRTRAEKYPPPHLTLLYYTMPL